MFELQNRSKFGSPELCVAPLSVDAGLHPVGDVPIMSWPVILPIRPANGYARCEMAMYVVKGMTDFWNLGLQHTH
jgi:hypothetical protein